MTDEYERFIAERARDAEHALFELRNALMGTGDERCERQARYIDRHRTCCAVLAREYGGMHDER